MRHFIAVCLLVVLPVARAAAARIVIDASTTLDYVIPPSDPPIDIVDSAAGPTIVEIVEGANIAPNIHVRDNSLLNIRGGRMGGFVWAHDQATINICDGLVATGEDVVADDSSLVNIYGGRFGESVFAVGSSILYLYGGQFEKAGDGALLGVANDGVIHVFGKDFALEPPGPVFRTLTDALSDGRLLNVDIYISSTALGSVRVELHSVPEPSSATHVFLAIGLVAALRCRYGAFRLRRTMT